MGKADAYRMAGYSGIKNAGQAGYIMESRNPIIVELIEARIKGEKAKGDPLKTKEIEQRLECADKMAVVEKCENAIRNADPETLRKIKFYRDIVDGKTKTVKRTIKKDKNGQVISETIEEVSDITQRIKAREMLDRTLGIKSVLDTVGRVEVGNITINIVDAGKKDDDIPENELNAEDIGATAEVIDGGEQDC
jgi:hypothetical protein